MRGLVPRWKAARATLGSRVRAWRVAARNRAEGSTCFYCGVAFEDDVGGSRQRTVDHRVPRSKGGSDRLANLVFACLRCNGRKGNRSERDFLASSWLAQRRRDVAGEQPEGDAAPGGT